MDEMKILRAFMVLSTIFFLAACSIDPVARVTGVFIDSQVEGLGYECGNDGTRQFTNAAGEFTCSVGDELRFYIGQILLGSVIVLPGLEVVTPAMLTGASVNQMTQVGYGESEPSEEVFSSLYMAMILQGFDEDGDPDNGIVIPAEVHELFEFPGVWDFGNEETPSMDDLFGALEDAEIEIPGEEEVFFHLLEQTEKLLHGLYAGSFVEEGETIQIHLLLFDNPGGGEAAPPGLQVRMLISDEFDPEPFPIDIGEPLVEQDDVLLAFDYSLDGIVVRVFDAVAMMEAQVDELMPGENGVLDLSPLDPFLLHTIQLDKVVSAPDVTMRDVGDFLAMLPNGDEVPEELEEMPSPRVRVEASTPRPDLPGEGPVPAMSEGGGMGLWGHTKALGLGGEFSDFFMPGGNLILSSIGDDTMVYRGRVFVVYFDEGDGQQEPDDTVTWGDATVTIHVDGSLVLEIVGDDGFAATETLEVQYAGVGGDGPY